MTDIDFDGLRAELLCAITALNAAKDSLKGRFDNPAVYAAIDLGHTIQNLTRGVDSLTRTEQILKGNQ
jgi:hypothetical protein